MKNLKKFFGSVHYPYLRLLDAKKNHFEWIYLFDGTSLDGWRAFNGAELPSGWSIMEGSLFLDTKLKNEANYEGEKSIIYTLEEFENFELYLEWKITEGGNSGIFYHVTEEYEDIIAPEYQLIDDLK